MTNDTPEMEGKGPDAEQAPATSNAPQAAPAPAEAPQQQPAGAAPAASGEAPAPREGRREGSDNRPAGRPTDGRGGPRGGGPGGRGGFRRDDAGGRRKRFTRRKLCPLCTAKVKHLDYKDVTRMKQFVTERGKIRPRRMTGMCAKHQRQVTVAIKRARNLVLMPYKM